jgi:hypothetical protein
MIMRSGLSSEYAFHDHCQEPAAEGEQMGSSGALSTALNGRQRGCAARIVTA